jgi:predicted outer membrane repeat protein
MNMRRTAILTGIAGFLVGLQALMAADIYVDISQSDDTGDGSSWSTAKKYLRSGLAIAVSSDDIYVAQGTYYPDEGGSATDNDPLSTFQLKSGVDIYGGYQTGGPSRDVSTYVTILSGDLDQSSTKNANDAYHVVTGANSATIDGVTISDGYANGGGLASDGAGMYNNSNSPTVNNCTFSNNTANQYGGAMFNGYGSSTPTITNCTFSDNDGVMGGGGINCTESSPTITGCVFSGNQTTSGSGGAMRQYSDGSPTVSKCTFSNNTAAYSGGGIFFQGAGTLSVTNSVFLNNTASANYGGGVYLLSSTMNVTNCTFYNNTAATSGDGFYDSASGGTIVNTILWGSNNQVAGSPAVTYSDVQQSSSVYTGTGNINEDPLFVSGSDLHLTNSSPCIGAGTSTGAPADDREGNTRPDPPGSDPDMGAYENTLEYSYKLVQTQIFLEGPYSGTEMTTALNSGGDLPVTSPYADSRVVNPIPNSDVVDWVYVQLRSTATGAEVVSRSAFLLKNGNVVDDDGSTNQIPLETAAGSYYIVLSHRNHLKVMSATAHALSATSSTSYDFTTASSQFYGGTAGAQEVDTGVWGMIAGDADGSGTVDALDRSDTWNDRNLTGYQDSDCDLTGTADANDRSMTWNNRNLTTSVP